MNAISARLPNAAAVMPSRSISAARAPKISEKLEADRVTYIYGVIQEIFHIKTTQIVQKTGVLEQYIYGIFSNEDSERFLYG